MKTLISAILSLALMTSVSASDDMYDPSTNLLTIPEITVDGVTYTDVVVTVGNVVSIGSSFNNNDNNNRTCSGSVTPFTSASFEFNLIMSPSTGTINAEITGLTNNSIFSTSSLTLIQNGKSTAVTPFSLAAGALWVGDDGFVTGTIPAGVTKTGTLSRFPPWLDLSEPFSWLYSGEEFTC